MKSELNSSINNKRKAKINLNSDIDLYKIPIKTLKTSKLSDFNGKLVYQLLTEMMNDSENINTNNIKYLNDPSNFFSPKTKPRNIIITNNSAKCKERARLKNENIYNIESNSNKNVYPNHEILKRFQYFNGRNPLKIEKINFQIKYDTKLGEDLAVIGSIKELGNWDVNKALKLGWHHGNIWKGVLYLDEENISEFEYKFILTCGGYVKKWEDGYNRKFKLLQIKALIDVCPGNYSHVYLKNIQGINIDFNYNDNTLNMICWWNIK